MLTTREKSEGGRDGELGAEQKEMMVTGKEVVVELLLLLNFRGEGERGERVRGGKCRSLGRALERNLASG